MYKSFSRYNTIITSRFKCRNNLDLEPKKFKITAHLINKTDKTDKENN